MMKYILIILIATLNLSCTGKSASADLYSAKEEAVFSKFINAKSMPKDPNLTVDKSIVNNNYPIEIALYKNHKFFYNLPRLGSGKGKWKYKNGKIELRAHRTLFDMYIEVYGGEVDFNKLAIQFSDRFGAKSLKMENNNIQ